MKATPLPASLNIKKLDVFQTLVDSWEYCLKTYRAMSLFALGHLAFFVAFEAMHRWKSPLFIPWLVLYYIFSVSFYRFYFNKKPYFALKASADSLVPSTKIIFITLLLLFILLFLPFIPLFLTNNTELLDEYTAILDAGIDKSKGIDLATNIVMIFISPIILYRPFMAWIASIMGRSPLLKTAFQKTRGNYWPFVLLSLLMNLPFILYSQIQFYFHIHTYLALLLSSPLIVYFYVILGECYKFFYLENDEIENIRKTPLTKPRPKL